MKTLITVTNVDTLEWFVSPKHDNFGLGDEWVPTTIYLPHLAGRNLEIEIDTEEKALEIYQSVKEGYKFVGNETWVKELLKDYNERPKNP